MNTPARFIARTITFGALGALALCAIFQWVHGPLKERLIWRNLGELVPKSALTESEARFVYPWVWGRPEREYEVGHVRLANGDIWRFAFLSHHASGTGESHAIFAGPLGVYRVSGSGFCCEVEFGSRAAPATSVEFLRMLAEGDTLEPPLNNPS